MNVKKSFSVIFSAILIATSLSYYFSNFSVNITTNDPDVDFMSNNYNF